MAKFVFITGGVVSSIGKGIVAASLGRLLKSRGYNVSILKLDPYLNVDPGTMSPFQHGEVFVTEDGAETDLDLGHYERFTDTAMSRLNSVTTGSIYQSVINKEPRDFSNRPRLAATIPLPMLDTTPPVMKTNLAMTCRAILQISWRRSWSPGATRVMRQFSSRLRNIQAVFSCTWRRWVKRSALG